MKNPTGKILLAGAVFAAMTGTAAAASTGKLSWFSESRFAGVGAVGAPELRPMLAPDRQSFDVPLYRSIQADEDAGLRGPSAGLEADSIRFYGEVDARRPSLVSGLAAELASTRRNPVFGVQWKHRLNALNSLSISAEYGENSAPTSSLLDNPDTRAAISWTSRLSGDIKPSITGSVFLGDEMGREDSYRLGRRYYGFSVGGSLTLFQSHTPYVSFRMQRSLYDSADPSSLAQSRGDQRSLLSAGWKWQVQRDISLQAEASYGLGDASSLDPYTLERSRIIFGTRFDFK